VAAGVGEEVVELADAHAEHAGGVVVAEPVAIGEEQDLLLHGVELAERSLEVDYSDVARVGFASSALFLT